MEVSSLCNVLSDENRIYQIRSLRRGLCFVLQALEASERAAAIKNTTDTVREAIQVAEEAQLAATEAIRSAEEVMKLARSRCVT